MTAAAVGVASPVSGHHSDAELEMDSIVMIEGTVTEYTLRNPHAYFTVRSVDERGEQIEWTVQMASAITVSRMGWTSDSLPLGERVTVGVDPAMVGRPSGLIESIEQATGLPLRSTLYTHLSESADLNTPTTTSTETRTVWPETTTW